MPEGYTSAQAGDTVELSEHSEIFHLTIEQVKVTPIVDLNPFVEEVLNINEQIEAEEQVDKGAFLNQWLEKTKEAEEQPEEELEVSSEPEQELETVPESENKREVTDDPKLVEKRKVETIFAIIREMTASEEVKKEYLTLVRQAKSIARIDELLAEFRQNV